MKVRVFYHDKCFDGACSAALFSRFYRERIRKDVNFVFSGLLHRAGSLFDEKQFDGDENAIVDFKYSSSPKITWWFDHHLSAFLTPEDAAHFEQDQSNRKFYDPDFKSCTSFIATIAQQRFGFDPAPVADLVHWTDIVDGAMYPDARTAVEMQAPAMKLTLMVGFFAMTLLAVLLIWLRTRLSLLSATLSEAEEEVMALEYEHEES